MKMCKADLCDQKATNRGYCNKHCQQMRKLGLLKNKKVRKRCCRVPGCSDHKIEAKGMCHKHYVQMLRHGKVFATRFEPNEFKYTEDSICIVLRDKKGNVQAETFVDKKDEWVKEHKWHMMKNKKNRYVGTFIDGKHEYLHRFFYPDSEQVDHIDRDSLNNRRSNLRPCTNTQNSWNTGVMSHNTSGVAGVRFCNLRKKWIARIIVDGKDIYLKQSSDFNEAVEVRREAEKKYYKEFAPNI